MPSRNVFHPLTTGFNFLTPKQASGVTPTLREAAWDPKSRVSEGAQEFGVFVQEAAAGGSALTVVVLVVESDSVAPVTIPDSSVATTQYGFVGILQGPAFNADGFDISNVSKFYHVYKREAVS